MSERRSNTSSFFFIRNQLGSVKMKGLCIKKPKYTDLSFQIVQIGAGANGSHFFRNMLQDIATYNAKRYSFDIKLVDEDKVEKKNFSNQLFDEEDLNEYKAIALAERYGQHYEIDVKSVTQYVTELEFLQKLFKPTFLSDKSQVVPVLIGMVDNNATRQLLDEFFHSDYLEDLIYIDAGVEGVLEDSDLSKEEKDSSGFSGQIVCGVKLNGKVWLEPVGRVFRNILEDEDTRFPNQSCGNAIINNPQRCATNKMAAQLANGYFNNLLHTGTIYSHFIDFNAQFGSAMPVFINKEIIQNFEGEMKK